MDGGAWWATVHGITESDTTEQPTLYFFSCKGLRNVHGNDHSINKGKCGNFSQKKKKKKNHDIRTMILLL